MKDEEIIKKNATGWNALIENAKPFSNTILPEYGPFLKRNEDEIGLLGSLTNKKVLDLGCGEGESLEYLYRKGAKEIYGLDISSMQIEKARRRFEEFPDHFVVSPMEHQTELPKDYFDIAISIFSIGYTSNLDAVFKNVRNYLKEGGYFVISWTHPFYNCLNIREDNSVTIATSYFDEQSKQIFKGPDKIELMQKNFMISSIVNTATAHGFFVEKILEEKTVLKDDVGGYKSTYWRKEKTENCPSTIIYKFKKNKIKE